MLLTLPPPPESSYSSLYKWSVPACAAKRLLTVPQAIVAALSHSQTRLPLHYRAKCHCLLDCRVTGITFW